MNRVDVINAVAALLALGGSLAAVGLGGGETTARDGETAASTTRYRRIASASTVADPLLRDLCPADRLVAVSTLTREGPHGHRYAGLRSIPSLEALEQIIGLSPEVLVVSNVGDARRVARLREAGIEVLDLGPPTGVASLAEDILAVGELCGRPDDAAEMAATLEARLERVSTAEAPRPRALYVTVYGGRYYGGTKGSSYHDVIRYAGLEDAAAERFTGFPQYTVEQLLALDPAFLITKTGMAQSICADDALARLAACRRGRVVEIDGAYLDDPGLGMLTAAERIEAATRPR